MNKSKLAALFLTLAGLVGGPAFADNTGLYLGGMVGKAGAAKTDACLDINLPCDRQDTSYSGNLGFMFTPNWGAEVAYNYLGKIVEQNDGMGSTSYAKSRAGSIALVGALPIQSVSLYAKFGAYRAKTDLTSSYLVEGSSKNNGWMYGVGVRWDVFSHVALRAELSRFNSVGGGAVGFRSDVNTMMGGMLITF